MKLVVAGPTGFVATEIIRQALSNPAITSVTALGRREVAVPEKLEPGADASKLKSVLLKDFGNEYPQDVKNELAGADAYIWTIANPPTDHDDSDKAKTEKICRELPIHAIETISQLPRAGAGQKPVRFVYMSGALAERDQTKTLEMMQGYRLIRGGAEIGVLEAGHKTNGVVQTIVVKPGLIFGPETPGPELPADAPPAVGLPSVDVSQVSDALLKLAADGSGKDTLSHDELVEIARGN